MNLYGLFILDVNIKYIVFSILYRHINVPMACKELTIVGEWFTWLLRLSILGRYGFDVATPSVAASVSTVKCTCFNTVSLHCQVFALSMHASLHHGLSLYKSKSSHRMWLRSQNGFFPTSSESDSILGKLEDERDALREQLSP